MPGSTTTRPRPSSPGQHPAPRDLHTQALTAQEVAPYVPHRLRPVRVRARHLDADVHVQPHEHPWAQVAYSVTGVLRVTTRDSTYLVPPTRGVWLPPGVRHAVTVVEEADMRTLYLHQECPVPGPTWPGEQQDATGWHLCRVLEVSTLLRELVEALVDLEMPPLDASSGTQVQYGRRYEAIGHLVLDELRRARPVRLGVDLPDDRRLRRLCQAIVQHPGRHDSLRAWTGDAGISARTATRLFREQLGTTFVQWRQQVLLAQALALAARGASVKDIAAQLGYASPSAFSAMVRKAVGSPPSRFFRISA